jgi:hypothetical protein
MSRKIDPHNLEDGDHQYLLDRPWIMDEFRRQGLVEEMDAVDEASRVRDDPNEKVRITTEDMRVGTQPPQKLEPQPNGVVGDDDDEEVNYSDWTAADLKAEIEARNLEPRAEKIATSGKKEELIARLEEDDAAENSA